MAFSVQISKIQLAIDNNFSEIACCLLLIANYAEVFDKKFKIQLFTMNC